MPTTLGLTPRFHPFGRVSRADAVAADGPLPLLAFSLTGLLAESLALLGWDDGAGLTFVSFVLIAGAPGLAAAAALRIARARSS